MVKDEIVDSYRIWIKTFESIANGKNELELLSDILIGLGTIGVLIKMRLRTRIK